MAFYPRILAVIATSLMSLMLDWGFVCIGVSASTAVFFAYTLPLIAVSLPTTSCLVLPGTLYAAAVVQGWPCWFVDLFNPFEKAEEPSFQTGLSTAGNSLVCAQSTSRAPRLCLALLHPILSTFSGQFGTPIVKAFWNRAITKRGSGILDAFVYKR